MGPRAALTARWFWPWLALVLGLGGTGCGDERAKPSAETDWHVVAEELPSALFSVTGTAVDDVWVVGADRGSGQGPAILHYDGEGWQWFDPGVDREDLVWVHAFEAGPVYAGGTAGLLLRNNGEGFEVRSTPASRDIWGIWGASPNDVWAVGGDPNLGTGFLWRDQGEGFEVVTLENDQPRPSAWYKVWGSASNDVWFCGVDGALLHFDGTDFEAVDAATSRTLLTIHGRPDGSLITAVGGQFSATLVSSEGGSAWRDVTPEASLLQPFGVYHRGHEAYAVGMQTTVLHHDGSVWSQEHTGLDLSEDFHAVWIDPEGRVWAVGGQLTAPPFTRGAIIYKGQHPPPELPL